MKWLDLYPKIREFFIFQIDSITDTMDSWFASESNSQRAKKVISRIDAKQRRLDRDEEKRKQREAAALTQSHVSAKAVAAHPVAQARVEKPMIRCMHCGGECKKTTESKSGCGCLLIIFGIGSLVLLSWTVIWIPFGILVMLVGLIAMMSYKGYWTCRACGSQAPRKVSWFEFTG